MGFIGLHDSHGRVSVQYPHVKLLRNYPFKFSGSNQSRLPESLSSLTFAQVASAIEHWLSFNSLFIQGHPTTVFSQILKNTILVYLECL